MARLLMVGVGFTGRPYLRAARDLGLKIHIVETHSWRIDSTDAPEVIQVDRIPDDGRLIDEPWLQGALKAADSGAFDGILAFSEPQVLAAAVVGDRLGRPGPSLRAATVSRNKAMQRACFEADGLPQPDFIMVTDHERAVDWARTRMPVVVKPLASSGSEGVILVRNSATLDRQLTARRSERLLVEQAVEGPEFSWEGLVRDGAVLFGNITAKETTGPPHFVETAHRSGHQFTEPATARSVEELTVGVVRSIGVRSGLVHLEFRITASGPSIMEVAVRTPGDFILDLLRMTYGFDPYRAIIQLALGLSPDLPEVADPGSFPAVWFPTCNPGTVTEIRGLDQVREYPFVTRAVLDVGIGDVVEPLHSSEQRIGYVLIDAPSVDEREKTLSTVRNLLHLEVTV